MLSVSGICIRSAGSYQIGGPLARMAFRNRVTLTPKVILTETRALDTMVGPWKLDWDTAGFPAKRSIIGPKPSEKIACGTVALRGWRKPVRSRSPGAGQGQSR